LLPPELKVPEWVVDRPAEVAAVVTALTGNPAGTVAITTGLFGAGGFGKTTLAQLVCADRRVRRRFGGRVYLVTIGRDVRGATAVAAKVDDVIKLVAGEDATFTDPDLAGRRLGSLLDAGPRRLLVLDDVWEPDQLAPFTEGGRRCARLVTTRVPGLLPGRALGVLVDQMSAEQAHRLLTSGLPPLDPTVAKGLLAVTGRWPLLLRLVNKILADYARVAPDASAKGLVLLEQLRSGGPAVVDEILGEADRGLDVGQPQKRTLAVRATIEASTSLLEKQIAERFAELGVFAEDETIPFGLVARLWRVTAGLDDLKAAQVCKRLVQLALVSEAASPGTGITLHDVIRDFLRAELGQRLPVLNGMLLDAVSADLPAASPLDVAGLPSMRAWWRLDRGDRYLWDHLIEHLLDAGRRREAEAAACDLRWVGMRLAQSGPASPAADLSLIGTSRASRLRDVLARVAHLLAPTEPPEAVVDILYSRVADDPEWGKQAVVLRENCRRSRLAARWPLPDLPDAALRRVLTSHTGDVTAVAVSPDGSWLASGSQDDTVRIWDVATGQLRTTLKSRRTRHVNAVTVSPDGSWLAAGGEDGAVRIWDVATGQLRAALKSRKPGGVRTLVVSPDGSWLAAGGWRKARIWDVATGRIRATLAGHTDLIYAMAAAPDGSWLASCSQDDTVRIWDAATGQTRASLEANSVRTVVVAPDGSWLAAGGWRGLQVWDAASWRLRATLEGASRATGMAVAPDGTWLALCGADQMVRVNDVATGQTRATMKGHTDELTAVAVSPDGSWLASGSKDGTVRIWDASTGQAEATQDSHAGSFTAIAVAPDGAWLASGGARGTVLIWDVATGQPRAALRAEHLPWGVSGVGVSPDGSWLASSSDADVRIWDVATGQIRATLRHRPRHRRYTWVLEVVAVSPDGSWLASGSNGGTVRIWNMPAGKTRATLYRHLRGVTALAASPDGTWLASAGRGRSVRIWDTATGRAKATLRGHTRMVNAIAVAPDGNWLASSSSDGTVRIWDTATGKVRTTLTGNTRVSALAIAPDSSLLASARWDGTVQIWDPGTWQASAAMRVEGSCKDCAFLGIDGLAVCGSAGLYLFDLFAGTVPAKLSPGDIHAQSDPI
jgi:WD40 repeat protein